MDRSILNVMPLLVQAGAILGRRTVKVSTKTLTAQIAYVRDMLRFDDEERQTAGPDPVLHQIDRTRAHLRQIAGIISHETRALERELAAIADSARTLVEGGEDGQMYRRRWRAIP